jgi:hypothetical protein
MRDRARNFYLGCTHRQYFPMGFWRLFGHFYCICTGPYICTQWLAYRKPRSERQDGYPIKDSMYVSIYPGFASQAAGTRTWHHNTVFYNCYSYPDLINSSGIINAHYNDTSVTITNMGNLQLQFGPERFNYLDSKNHDSVLHYYNTSSDLYFNYKTNSINYYKLLSKETPGASGFTQFTYENYATP